MHLISNTTAMEVFSELSVKQENPLTDQGHAMRK